jgi:hypothetical protein
MKKKNYLLKAFSMISLILLISYVSCNKDEDVPDTTIALSITETDPMNIGETLTVEVTIVAGDVVSLKYYKVVDNVNEDAVDVTTNVVSSGDDHTYTFTYVLQDGDDLRTLGFEFEVTDGKDVVTTASVLVNTVLSIKSSFVKYDWTITAETWLGGDVLAAHDAAKTFRFNEDGTYDVDLGTNPDHLALAAHHYCYWVYKDTPANGDTIAELRLIRRLVSGETALDENYDFRITAANESEMTMFWDIAFWGLLDIQRTFKSQPKGAFVKYGTAEKEAEITGNSSLDCSNVDDSLLDF